MFRDEFNCWNPPADFPTNLKFPRELILSADIGTLREWQQQLDPVVLSRAQELKIEGQVSTREVEDLLITLPEMKHLEVLSFSAPIVDGLNKECPEWWSALTPASDPQRLSLVSTLLNRDRFSALRWVRACDAIWKIEGASVYQPYIPHEPGIDFL